MISNYINLFIVLLNLQHSVFGCKRISISATSAVFGWELITHSLDYGILEEKKSSVFHTCGSIVDSKNSQNYTNCVKQKMKSAGDAESGIIFGVLNKRTGAVSFLKILATAQPYAQWAALIWYINKTPAGSIVFIAISGGGAKGLNKFIPIATGLGSLNAVRLCEDSLWIWIFNKRGKTLLELFSKNSSQIQSHIVIDLFNQHLVSGLSQKDKLRWEICSSYTLFGQFCDESSPSSLNIKPTISVDFESMSKVPIIITAGGRPHYMLHTLNILLQTPGVIKSNIIVLLGTSTPSVFSQILDIFNVKYYFLPLYGKKKNSILFQYYRRAFKFVIDNFPKAKAAIFLDEDVEVSPDIFYYFNQTIDFLKMDKSIYCINSYSAARSKFIPGNPTKVLRANVQVNWGYAVSNQFIRYALDRWSSSLKVDALYDTWLYAHVAEGRDCIYPEVSRSKHIGLEGTNTDNYQAEKYLVGIHFVHKFGINLSNLHQMTYKRWRIQLKRSISSATILRHPPCSDSKRRKLKEGNYVLYIQMDVDKNDTIDLTNYYFSGLCLGLWSYSEQGMHDGIAIAAMFSSKVIYLVGVPLSTMSFLKPKDIIPWRFDRLNRSNKLDVIDGINSDLDDAGLTVNRCDNPSKLHSYI